MRDELTFNASEKNRAPRSPMALSETNSDFSKEGEREKQIPRARRVRDELTLSASDSDDAPESSIPLKRNCCCKALLQGERVMI